VLLAGSGVAVHAASRPTELEGHLDDFVAAWNASDVDSLEAMLVDGERVRRDLEALRSALRKRAWQGKRPPGAEPQVADRGSRSAHVAFTVAGEPMATRWEREGRIWALAALHVPPPPIAPVVDRFLATWNRSDVDGLLGFYRANDPDRIERGLRRS